MFYIILFSCLSKDNVCLCTLKINIYTMKPYILKPYILATIAISITAYAGCNSIPPTVPPVKEIHTIEYRLVKEQLSASNPQSTIQMTDSQKDQKEKNEKNEKLQASSSSTPASQENSYKTISDKTTLEQLSRPTSVSINEQTLIKDSLSEKTYALVNELNQRLKKYSLSWNAYLRENLEKTKMLLPLEAEEAENLDLPKINVSLPNNQANQTINNPTINNQAINEIISQTTSRPAKNELEKYPAPEIRRTSSNDDSCSLIFELENKTNALLEGKISVESQKDKTRK